MRGPFYKVRWTETTSDGMVVKATGPITARDANTFHARLLSRPEVEEAVIVITIERPEARA